MVNNIATVSMKVKAMYLITSSNGVIRSYGSNKPRVKAKKRSQPKRGEPATRAPLASMVIILTVPSAAVYANFEVPSAYKTQSEPTFHSLKKVTRRF